MLECDITQAKRRDRKQESIEVSAAEKSGKEMKITLCILYLEVIGDFNKMIIGLLGIKARLKGLGPETDLGFGGFISESKHWRAPILRQDCSQHCGVWSKNADTDPCTHSYVFRSFKLKLTDYSTK